MWPVIEVSHGSSDNGPSRGTSNSRRIPADGKQMCTGSALAAISPTDLNLSSQGITFSALSRRSTSFRLTFKRHLFCSHNFFCSLPAL